MFRYHELIGTLEYRELSLTFMFLLVLFHQYWSERPANQYLQEHCDLSPSQWLIKVETKHHKAARRKTNSMCGCSVLSGTISAQILLLMIIVVATLWPHDLTTSGSSILSVRFRKLLQQHLLSRGKDENFRLFNGRPQKMLRENVSGCNTGICSLRMFEDKTWCLQASVRINRGVHSRY